MIDPNNITNFERTAAELEEFLMFAVMVAGKNSKTTAKKLHELLCDAPEDCSPFEYLQALQNTNSDGIENALRKHKVGQYTRISRAFFQMLRFNGERLKTVSLDLLENVSGIGPKTARFFLVHSRPNQNFAVLDVHILRWLNKYCYVPCRYTSTPPSKAYKALEKIFLEIAAKLKMTSAALDLEVWSNRESHEKLTTLGDTYLRIKHEQTMAGCIEQFAGLFKPADVV